VALAAVGVLVVGLVTARHLRALTSDSGLRAAWVSTEVLLEAPALLRLDLVLAGERELVGIRRLSADGGWALLGPLPSRIGTGAVLSVTHPVGCERRVSAPRRLTLRTAEGRSLVVPVRVRGLLDLCDPLQGPDAVRVVSSSLTNGRATMVRLGLVDISTRPVRLSAIAFDGFAFTAHRPMPITLPGRDRHRSLDVERLAVTELVLVASVQQCAAARHALDEVVYRTDPDRLGAVLDGRIGDLQVRGISAYLDLQWRATCVP
jgi:hypothetical protein